MSQSTIMVSYIKNITLEDPWITLESRTRTEVASFNRTKSQECLKVEQSHFLSWTRTGWRWRKLEQTWHPASSGSYWADGRDGSALECCFIFYFFNEGEQSLISLGKDPQTADMEWRTREEEWELEKQKFKINSISSVAAFRAARGQRGLLRQKHSSALAVMRTRGKRKGFRLDPTWKRKDGQTGWRNAGDLLGEVWRHAK